MDNKELEIVAQGEFFDQGYRVVTIVVRLIGQDIRQPKQKKSRRCLRAAAFPILCAIHC